MKKNLTISLIITGIILLGGIFFAGWKSYPHFRPCPVPSSNTIHFYDTTTYHIYDTLPWYDVITDTIIYDSIYYDTINIDTAALIKDYFAKHIYERKWEDSLLYVNIIDTISRNKSIGNLFTYKILRPQEIIIHNYDNSVHYNKYIQFGIGLPFKDLHYINLETSYIFPKGYVGAEWIPELKSFGIKGGITILKIK